MDIKFCENCSNLLNIYLVTEGEAKSNIEYRCKNCNYKSNNETLKSFCVYKNDIENTAKIKELKVKMNDFVKFDPTLAEISHENIKCPNESCQKNEIVYLLNDRDEMKYTYICKACDTQWVN